MSNILSDVTRRSLHAEGEEKPAGARTGGQILAHNQVGGDGGDMQFIKTTIQGHYGLTDEQYEWCLYMYNTNATSIQYLILIILIIAL